MANRKSTATALAFAIAAAAPLAGQDAQTVPRGALWWRLQAAVDFAGRAFDGGGERGAIPSDSGAWTAVSAGAAGEVGLSDWTSIEVDWLAGFNLWSTLDYPAQSSIPNDKATLYGPHDLWLGFRLQAIGEPGMILEHERVRLVLAPGLVVPLPEPDWKVQRERALDGKRYVYRSADRHAVGIGLRAAAQYVVNDAFSVIGRGSFVQFARKASVSIGAPSTTQDTDYGYELIVAVEPRATLDLGRVRLEGGLGVKNVVTRETLVDNTVAARGAVLLTAEPWVGVRFVAREHPLLLSVGWGLPLAGSRSDAANEVRVRLESSVRS